MKVDIFPAINAILNATSALLLVAGFIMIRKKRVPVHRTCMVGALCTSVIFLISYLAFHYYKTTVLGQGITRFKRTGIIHEVYIFVLTTHTSLAVLVAPLALFTLYRALKGEFVKHRKISRWTLPLWLYVSITGVIVYFMLYHMN